jgi:hypothetical protein
MITNTIISLNNTNISLPLRLCDKSELHQTQDSDNLPLHTSRFYILEADRVFSKKWLQERVLRDKLQRCFWEFRGLEQQFFTVLT